MNNNKGLTLVELLVTIAIVGVISSTILGFIITGANSYKSTSADVNVQYEAQLTINQLQDLIIDANDVQILESPIVGAKTYYDSYIYEIQWEQTEQQLIYYKCDITNGEIAPKTTENRYLLSNCVSNFKIGLETVEKKVVQMELEFNQQGKKYSTFNNITLRNKNSVKNSTNGSSIGRVKIKYSLVKDGLYTDNLDITLTNDPIPIYYRIEGVTNYSIEWSVTNGFGIGDGSSNNIKVDINSDNSGFLISVKDKNSGGQGQIIPHLYIDNIEYALDADNLITYRLLPPGQESQLKE